MRGKKALLSQFFATASSPFSATCAFQVPGNRLCRIPSIVKQHHRSFYPLAFTPLDNTALQANNGESNEEYETYTKRNQLRSWLNGCEPLSNLSDVDLEVLTQLMKERKLTKDEVLLEGAGEANEFFMVSKGALEAYEYDGDGNEVKLFSYAPGDAVGAISYASKKPYLYSVRVTSDTGASVWCIDTKSLDGVFQGKKGTIQDAMLSKYSQADSQFAEYIKRRVNHDLVSGCDIFDDLTENDKQAVAEKLVPVDVLSKGEVLFTEGDDVENPKLYILEEGTLEAYNNKKVLKKYVDGGYVGELNVLLYRPRTASVRVSSNSAKLYTLSRSDLIESTRESGLDKIAKEKLLSSYSYQGKSRLTPKDVYDLWVLKSLPKRKPVSLHSMVSTMTMGATLLMLASHFAPRIRANGFRFFRLVVENPSNLHVRLLNACNVGMFMTMLCGWLRFPKKGQSIRKVGFATINVGQVFHTFVALSNIMGPGTGYLIDAWSWPGRVLIAGSWIAMCFMTGLLYNISFFGPKMPDQPFFENHWRGFLASTVFAFSNFGQTFHILPMLESRAKFEAITYPLYDLAVGNGECLLTFVKFLTNLYLSFGGFIATLQFEKRFSVRTCNIMLGGWAVLLLTDLYKFHYDIVQLAKDGLLPQMQIVSYLTGVMSKYHINTAFFGSIALIMMYGAFQSFVKRREMVGLFKWRLKETK